MEEMVQEEQDTELEQLQMLLLALRQQVVVEVEVLVMARIQVGPDQQQLVGMLDMALVVAAEEAVGQIVVEMVHYMGVVEEILDIV
jgi:hypothetical protein